VEFAAPLGYVEPSRQEQKQQQMEEVRVTVKF